MIKKGHHPPDVVWGYTPRQIAAWMLFMREDDKQEMAQSLTIGAMASRGDPKKLKKQIEDLSK